MTRAALALVDYAVDELDLNRVEIRCGTGNTASCAVAKRLGMELEGVMRQAEWVNDHYVDWNIFATHAADWRAARESL
jgi:ribosomal-protein-serine acetyltransferase